MAEGLRRQVRTRLASVGVSLAEVVRTGGLDYARIQRILGGYARPQSGEIAQLLAVIERVVQHSSVDTENDSGGTGQGVAESRGSTSPIPPAPGAWRTR